MPRNAQPFLRKQTKTWYCSINRKQVCLGKDRDIAFQKFYELMAEKEDHSQPEQYTLYQISQSYLDWCQENRKPNTYELHRHFLKSFIAAIGKRLRPRDLKIYQVAKWQDSLKISSTSKHGAISVIKRMLNWAMDYNYIQQNPIARMKKPKAKRRDVYYTQDQWQLIRQHAEKAVLELLDFLYFTGCRPQEARILEARHLYNDLIIFPADESKGDREPRVIYLVPQAKAIIDRLVTAFPTGPLFRNKFKRPWTKDSIKCSLTRITQKVGFRVIAYGLRHTYATEALITGGVDPISVAHLMGHKDTSMISKVYSHLAKNPDFLRKQALKAIGEK